MLIQDHGLLRSYRFESFDRRVCQGIFSRQGGGSPPPWESLNMGSTVGDDPHRVSENRRLALNALKREQDSVYDVWQVHGVDVVIAKAPRDPSVPHLRADAILTDVPGITLMMRFADCVPVFIHDPIRNVVGMAHAGWMGTVAGVIPAMIRVMQATFGSNPTTLIAGLGPSIGPDHYEIGSDVENRVRAVFGDEADRLLSKSNQRVHLDLWSANRMQLLHSGIKNIEVSGICTACDIDEWFSHRAEKGVTGRFGAMIGLN